MRRFFFASPSRLLREEKTIVTSFSPTERSYGVVLAGKESSSRAALSRETGECITIMNGQPMDVTCPIMHYVIFHLH